jgi:hypothetical protein
MQHTSETSETLETYACNMCFEVQHLLVSWTKWRLIDAELDTDVDLDVVEWRRAANGRAAA